MQPLITVITPTIGRQTLVNTLQSSGIAFDTRIQHIVIGDGIQTMSRCVALEYGAQYCETRETHNWGATQRNVGIKMALGKWILFCDDDDVLVYSTIQNIMEHHMPCLPHIFRMQYADGGLLWEKPEMKLGNVGTPMFVIPNTGLLGIWTDRYEGDFDFLCSTVHLYSGKVIWSENILAKVRPC